MHQSLRLQARSGRSGAAWHHLRDKGIAAGMLVLGTLLLIPVVAQGAFASARWAACHGADGEGKPGFAEDMTDSTWKFAGARELNAEQGSSVSGAPLRPRRRYDTAPERGKVRLARPPARL